MRTDVTVASRGVPGSDGIGWSSGTGAPTADQPDGSLYLDNSTGIYYKRIADAWVVQSTLKGVDGDPGPSGEIGPAGQSAYGAWLALGHQGSLADFIASLHGGENGLSAYQLWLSLGNTGTEQDFLHSVDGKSAFQIWLDLGNVGTEQDFIDSLKGEDGESAFQAWLDQPGNSGHTEAEFIASLKGDRGDVGPAGAPGNANYRSLTFQSPEGGPFESFPAAYREVVGGVFPSSIVWYEDSTKAKRIVARVFERDSNKNPTKITTTLYNTDGLTPLRTSVDTIAISGPFELSRTRVTT